MCLSSRLIFRRGRSPIVAAAIHHGHDTHDLVDQSMGLEESLRRREEDPCTGEWAQVAKTQIVGLRTRFEVDLNRPRAEAVYLQPADAWGLTVWSRPPDSALMANSLKEYDEFYEAVEQLLCELVEEHGRVVVYDLHSYNHRRDGVDAPPAEERRNPEVNVGTGTMDRRYWCRVVERFIDDLRAYDFHGRQLDVRENIKFEGGYFGKWIHETFPEQVCSLAIEIKKFYIDEWTGIVDLVAVEEIFNALRSTIPGVERELEQW